MDLGYRLRGFTLIEMMIVMIIIGTLGFIGTNLSRSTINQGKAIEEASKLHNRYNTHLTTSMTSTVGPSGPYTGWTASIQSGGNTMTIVYHDGSGSSQTYTLSQGGYFFIQGADRLSRTTKALKIECSIMRPTTIYLVYPFKRFCRQIIPKTCTLFSCDF